MATTKAWWKSRTVWVNALMFLLAIVSVFQSTPFISAEYLVVINSIINVVLRFVTIDAIGMFDE